MGRRARFKRREARYSSYRGAFTLVEILIVIAIIAILAAMLLPALSSAKAKGQRVSCINHLKELAIASQMYSADNDGKLPENAPQVPTPDPAHAWVLGNLRIPNDATNATFIRQSRLFPYANNAAIFHCAADRSQTNNAARVRSYSMNSWMGSRYMETEASQRSYRTFVRESEIAISGPARLWVICDEDEVTIDDGFFLVTMNDSKPFASFPGARHDRGYALNFADSHVELFKLHDGKTPLTPGTQVDSFNTDWLKLKQVTTVQ